MKRRSFLTVTAGGVVAGGCSGEAARKKEQSAGSPPVKFVLGCQSGPTTDERLRFFKRYGVEHICGYPDKRLWGGTGHYTVESLEELRSRCESRGIQLDMVPAPFLASSYIDRERRPAIMLGESPRRDRDIEDIQKTIVNCAKVGVPALKYNMSILGVLRTGRTSGRGGISLSTWKRSEAKPKTPKTRAGDVAADTFWERITYFLERVVPVANENRVRLACHPHDPGVPPEGYQGVDRVLGTVEGLKKLVSIEESPYHGINFCQGTVSEMLRDPAGEICDVIRYFGSRKKIFNVHFRNIRGHRGDFVETFPDNGDVDMIEAALAYKETGYPYMLMPDHVPHHPDDPRHLQAFAYCYGYIKATIQGVSRLG